MRIIRIPQLNNGQSSGIFSMFAHVGPPNNNRQITMTEKSIFVIREADWILFRLLTYSGSLRNFIIGLRSKPCFIFSIRAKIARKSDQIPISLTVGKTFLASIIQLITPKAINEKRFNSVKKMEWIQKEEPNLSFKNG